MKTRRVLEVALPPDAVASLAGLARELAGRQRLSLTWVLCGLVVGGWLHAWLRSSPWSRIAPSAAWGLLSTALLVGFAIFQFTEGQRRAGFGSFPVRLFTLPIRTRWLVAWPLLWGSAGVVMIYVAGVFVLFAPVGMTPPLLWPSLYLSAGFCIFQSILWAVPRRRYLRLLCLGAAATVILVSWMFFLPHVVEGTLATLGYTGSSVSFLRRLLAGVSMVGPSAYLFSVWCIRAQRHTAGARGGRPWFERMADWVPARQASFRSAADGLKWLEWRRTGWILPLAVACVMVLTALPSYLSRPLGPAATIGLFTWMLLAPPLLAAIVGRGFGTADFWASGLAQPAHRLVEPVTEGEWIGARLAVAWKSVWITWGLTAGSLFLWAVHAADFQGLDRIWWLVRWDSSLVGGVVLTGLTTAGLVILTWRLLVGSMVIGLSGCRTLYYLANALFAAALITGVGLLISMDDSERNPIRLYQTWPWIEAAPHILGICAVARSGVAAWAWQRTLRARLIDASSARRHILTWCVMILVLLGWAACFAPHTAWLRHLLMLAAILLAPLDGPALAMISLRFGRAGHIPRPQSAPNWTWPVLVPACTGAVAVVLWIAAARTIPGRVRVGDHQVRVSIQGTGSPAVIFDCFGRAPLEVWNRVQPEVSRFARTITYDHAGYNASQPGPPPRNARQIAQELREMLRRTGVEPPYLLVGYSFGGPYVRVFASSYPDEIAGIVLVDPTQEDFMEWLSETLPEFVAIPPRSRTESSEAGCQWVSMAQARAATLPDVPIALITAMKSPGGIPPVLLERWCDEHRRWLRQFPNAEHIITPRSTHAIPMTEPDLIITAIRRMMPRGAGRDAMGSDPYF